jgi:hypothetical protein
MTETPPVRLVVLGPGRQVYGTRALVAGDQFEMPREWADILIRLGKARLAAEKPTPTVSQVQQIENVEASAETAATVDPTVPAKPAIDSRNEQPDLDSLRREAKALGIEVDGRWGTVRLNYEIAQAKSK